MPAPFPHDYQTWLVRTLSSRAPRGQQHWLITNALRAPVDVDAKIRPPAVREAG